MSKELSKIDRLKHIMEICNTEDVTVNKVLQLVSEIVIEQDKKIEELELTIDTLQRQIDNG